MDRHGREGIKAWTPLFFSLILIIGMVLGFNLRDSLRSKRDIATTLERNDRLEQVIDLINEKYVDSVNTDNLYKDALTGILHSLDPHTVYIPAEELQSVNDDLEGGFSGIGVEFSIVRDTIEVTSVIENGPASQVGVELGDQLIKVGDSVVAGVNITSDRIVRLLKGKQRSNVAVTVKHAFSPVLKQVVITRDLIAIHSVEASIMVNEHTGYIKIARFSATTHKEFAAALKGLKESGASQLIIDLRDNPGGYVDQATSMADELLADDKMLLYTEGTHSPRLEYKSSVKGIFETGRLAVLIDESSASASEIFAGAIQDWDRGVIVGRRSFGKGLVQEPYELPDGSELRLTIAKYYTPSGRCIQRSFAKGKDAYEADYEKRFQDGELIGREVAPMSDTVPYYTAAHRVVYGGGGIKPDVFVPYDTARFTPAFTHLIADARLRAVIWDYFIRNMRHLKYKNVAEFARNFDGQEQVIDSYMDGLDTRAYKQLSRELRDIDNKRYLDDHIKAQIARFLFKDNGYYSISIKEDEVVSKALDILGSAEYLHIISGK